MLVNCLSSAAYVRPFLLYIIFYFIYFFHSFAVQSVLNSSQQVLSMRKRIKATGFSDWDTMFYNNLLSIPVLAFFSFILEDWGTENLTRNL